MPFGAQSSQFRQHIADFLTRTAGYTVTWNDATAGAYKVALFGDTGTPNKDATALLSAYAAAGSPWAVPNEVTDAGGYWPAGGVDLVNPSFSLAAGELKFDADPTTGLTAAGTLADVFGDLLYFTPAGGTTPNVVPNQGLAFHAFTDGGGVGESVNGGTFTIVWNPAGILLITFS
jgi:hypothetical protein